MHITLLSVNPLEETTGWRPVFEVVQSCQAVPPSRTAAALQMQELTTQRRAITRRDVGAPSSRVSEPEGKRSVAEMFVQSGLRGPRGPHFLTVGHRSTLVRC